MPLFGAETSRRELELRVDSQDLVLGETLEGSVGVVQPDPAVRQGRLELLYRNTFWHGSGQHAVTSTKDIVVASEPFPADRVGEHRFSFALPLDQPCSAATEKGLFRKYCQGKIVDWQLRAVVDRPRRRDLKESVDLYVYSPPESLAALAERPPEASHEACAFQFRLASRSVRPGEAVSGSATVTAREALTARSVRAQLQSFREEPSRSLFDEPVKQELDSDLSLAPGQSRTFQFSLQVPPDAIPSFLAAANFHRWFLQLVLDRRRHDDYVGSVELNVHTAPAA